MLNLQKQKYDVLKIVESLPSLPTIKCVVFDLFSKILQKLVEFYTIKERPGLTELQLHKLFMPVTLILKMKILTWT